MKIETNPALHEINHVQDLYTRVKLPYLDRDIRHKDYITGL